MSDYGVTTEGFVKKRADTIYDEMQETIKKGTDIDISVNQKSYINVLIWSMIDKITEMWDVAEAVYYSLFPSTAEGANLDYSCQFGGVVRKEGTSSKFWILCTGDDGTRIPMKTDSNSSSTNYARIATSAKPTHYLTPMSEGYISTSQFNKCRVKVLDIEYGTEYTITLSNISYTIISPTQDDIDKALIGEAVFGVDTENIIGVIKAYRAGKLADGGSYDADLSKYYEYADEYDEQVEYEFVHELLLKFVEVLSQGEKSVYIINIAESGDSEVLVIESVDEYTNAAMEMSDNLTAESVSSVVVFETEELGEFRFNQGVVDTIINQITGFASCSNMPIGMYGSLRETDEELRESYIKKMGLRSTALTTSISSAIINNCEGVLDAVCFENDTCEVVNNMPCHSIFVVVDGGAKEAIAEQIYYYKPAGIYTWDGTYEDESGATHNEEYARRCEVPTDYNSSIWISYATPQLNYAWLKIELFRDMKLAVSLDLKETVQEAVQEFADTVRLGEDVYVQRMIPTITEKTIGIAYMNVTADTSTDPDYVPSDPAVDGGAESTYTQRYITATQAQKVAFDVDDRLLVILVEYIDGKEVRTVL